MEQVQTLEEFVAAHLIGQLSSVVEFILQSKEAGKPFGYNQIDNFKVYVDCMGNTYTTSQRDQQLRKWQQELDDLEPLIDFDQDPPMSEQTRQAMDHLQDCINSLQTAQPEARMIHEWWGVTRKLGDQLLRLGEPVIIAGNMRIWGRTATGAAIIDDEVVVAMYQHFKRRS